MSNGFPQNISKFEVRGRGSPNSLGHLYHSFANLFLLQIDSPNGLVSFLTWMSAQTWKRVPFHGIFSLPLPPPLCLHAHTALCGAEFTEGLWEGQKQEISPQHENLKLNQTSCSEPSEDALPHRSYLLGFLITIIFSSDLRISFLHPFLVLPSIKPSVQGLTLLFKHFSKVLP